MKLFKYFYLKKVDSIKAKHIDEWLYKLHQKTYKKERFSFKNECQVLKTLFIWHIKNNEKAKLQLPFKERHKDMINYKQKTKVKLRYYLTTRELTKFLICLKELAPHFYPIAVLQVYQVKRISEVCAMEWDYLDLKQKTYNFCKMVEFIEVKSKQKAILRLGKKNMKIGDFDIQPLRVKSLKILNSLKRKRDFETRLIFHHQRRLWHYKEIVNKYNLAFKKAGLDFTGTHVLRHTGATLFLSQTNGNFMALKELGGWSNMNQVLHYGKVTQIHLKKAIKQADRFLSA